MEIQPHQSPVQPFVHHVSPKVEGFEDIDIETKSVETEEELQLDPETVQAYLEAIAAADSAQSSISSQGYLITGLAVAGLGLLALLNLSQARENSFLREELFTCKDAHTEDFSELNWDHLKPTEGSQYYGNSMSILSNFFDSLPQSSPTQSNPNCKYVHVYAADVLQQIKTFCLEKTPITINENRDFVQTLNFKYEASNFGSLNQNTTHTDKIFDIKCEEKITSLSQRTLEVETTCKETDKQTSLTFSLHETLKAQMLPGSPFSGLYTAKESLKTDLKPGLKETYQSHFSKPKQLKHSPLPILSAIIGQLSPLEETSN